MKIQGNVVVKSIELDLLSIDGVLEGILDEFDSGVNVQYEIIQNNKTIAIMIPHSAYKETESFLKQSIDIS